jgi:hypothetical protein
MDNINFEANEAIILLGPRKSGKSYIVKQILKEKGHEYELILIFTNSVGVQTYKEIIDSKCIFPNYSPIVLRKFIDLCGMNKQEEDIEAKGNMKFLVIFDDCVSMKQRSNNEIAQLFTQGRHYGITTLYCSQSSGYIAPEWRKNVDKMIITKSPTGTSRDNIIEEYMTGVLSDEDLRGHSEKEVLREIIKNFTEGYNCLIIDFMSETNSPQDTFLKCKF